MPRVLVVHNRYRIEGGEERSVDLHLRALERAGVEHALFERRSGEAGRRTAARALLAGGAAPDELGDAVRAHGATVVHAHNTLPLIGPKGLAAARDAGAGVLLHLHNVRIFCATGFGERDGGPCARCRGRNTLPGLVLNCRRSLPEAVAYASGLSLHQPLLLESVGLFVTPSEASARDVVKRGLPASRVRTLPHYLPAEAFAERSRAGAGEYALVAARLSPEKGIDAAIKACATAGVPLRIAGEGPERARLEALAGPDVKFLGRLTPESVAGQLAGAAMLLMPSRYHEFSPYSAIEAIAQGVPIVATMMGGLPELIGPERCVAPGDEAALAARVGALWADPGLRAGEGEALLARARERHGEAAHLRGLLELYAEAGG